jgi:hypothetical protein
VFKVVETKEDVIVKQIDKYVEKNIEEQIPFTAKEHHSLAVLHHNGKFGRKKCLKTAITHYNECIRLSKTEQTIQADCFFGLAHVYEEMNNGQLVLHNYLMALENGMEQSIIEIGKLYLNGLHPHYLADKILAGRVFSTFINFSETLNPWCKLHLQEIHDIHYIDLDAIPQNNINHARLPSNIIDSIQNATTKMKTLIPFKEKFNTNWLKKYEEEDEEGLNLNVLDHLPVQIVRNDIQNVHDHSLQNIGKQIIDVLESKIKSSNKNFSDNVQDLLKKVNHTKYPNVKRVCESLGDLTHSKYDRSEQDVFNLVWEKAKDNEDINNMFMYNLDSSVEHDYVVCSTGKIMRMLSTLDVIDKDTPDLKPDWVIKEEITQTISKIIRDLKPYEKKQYESENNGHISEVIKDRVRSKCRNDYENILDEPILNIYLSNYLEYI